MRGEREKGKEESIHLLRAKGCGEWQCSKTGGENHLSMFAEVWTATAPKKAAMIEQKRKQKSHAESLKVDGGCIMGLNILLTLAIYPYVL